MLKPILIILGTISLMLGITGIFLPGLPTTPFLLLTAGLYVRSSEKLYNLLVNNKFLGSYIHNFRKNKGISIHTKVYSIATMWTMILISAFVFIRQPEINGALFVAGIIGTLIMGWIIPTIRK